MADRVPVHALRHAVEGAVKASSLRSVARDVGLSPMGLSAFIGGTDPQGSTIQKLTTWYLRTLGERGERTTGTTARAALGVLVDFLPERQRGEVVRELRRSLEKQARAAGVPLPDWVEELSG